MDKGTRKELHTFFEQFTKLSERAAKQWPDKKAPPKESNNSTPYYQFACIRMQDTFSDVDQALVVLFFQDLYKVECAYSPNLLPSTKVDIKSRTWQHSIPETVQAEEPKKALVCSALLLAWLPQNGTTKTKAIGGLVLNYYPKSRSILIESILLNTDEGLLDRTSTEYLLSQLINHKSDPKRPQAEKSLYTLFSNLIKDINSKNRKKITGVYHEANDPVLVKKRMSQKMANVLDSFHTVGAKHLRFAYKSPIAANPKKSTFFLLYFPDLLPYRKNHLVVDIKNIKEFITEYISNSNQTNPAFITNKKGNEKAKNIEFIQQYLIHLNDESLSNNTNLLSNEIYLSNVPRLERPKFLYKRAAICFEVLVDEDYFEPIGFRIEDNVRPPGRSLSKLGQYYNVIQEEWYLSEDPKPKPLNCIVSHSTETDLFAYRYQADPPYFTKYYCLLGGNDVTVKLPSHSDFTSEGRQETYYVLPSSIGKLHKRERKNKNTEIEANELTKEPAFTTFFRNLQMEVHLSYTYFRLSNVRIWHIVFTPKEKIYTEKTKVVSESTSGISELDIIKLMKFFSGSQENASEEEKQSKLNDITFHYKKPVITVLSPPASNYLLSREFLKVILWIRTTIHFIVYYVSHIPSKVIDWLQSKLYKTPDLEEKYQNTSNEVIKDKRNKEKKAPIIKLLEEVSGITYRLRPEREDDPLLKPEDKRLSLRNLRSGIVEIDTGDPDEDDTINLLGFNAYNLTKFYEENKESLQSKSILSPEALKQAIRAEIKNSYSKLYKKEEGESAADSLLGSDEDDPIKTYTDYVFKAYCGICLGIFDYDRMGLEEIDDTLMPLDDSKTEQSFQALNRGVLAMFGYEEDVMNTFWKTLGISPYLSIPSAVLAHNDSVSFDAEKRLDSILEKIRTDRSTFSIPELIGARHEIDDLLNDDILPNVFHYKTEKAIYVKE